MVPQGSPEVIYHVYPPIYILDDKFMSFLCSNLLCSHSSYDFDSYFPAKVEARSLSLMFPPAHRATYLHCKYYHYIDDYKIYFSPELQTHMPNCVLNISIWMSHKKFSVSKPNSCCSPLNMLLLRFLISKRQLHLSNLPAL